MTAQVPDILIHRGQRLSLCSTPLYDYIEKRGGRRPRFARISTACWRGYVATWSIRDGKLYLDHIEGDLQTGRKHLVFTPATLANVLPELAPPIVATWVSDELRCPEGRLRSYCHNMFASEYDRDRLFYVRDGEVHEEWLRLNPPDPICYRIEADGTRTRFDGMHREPERLDDPFPPNEMPKGYVVRGQPEPEVEEEGYMLGGYVTFGRPAPGG